MTRELPSITKPQMKKLIELGQKEKDIKDLNIKDASKLIGKLLKEQSEQVEEKPQVVKETKAKKSAKKETSSTTTEKTETKSNNTTSKNVVMNIETNSVNRLTKYLEDFANKDKHFKTKFNKDKMKDCMNYIGSEVYKQANGSNGIMCEDDDIFALARHFFLDVLKETKETEENDGFKIEFKNKKEKQKDGFTQIKLDFNW